MTQSPVTAEDIATLIIRDVAELPDRTSPDDWPEAMLVTYDELRLIILERLSAIDPMAKGGEPIDMILHCPKCGLQHIDAPDLDEIHWIDGLRSIPWHNPPHRSHLCQGCGLIWRPADVATNGVAAIATRGKNDGPSSPDRPGGALASVRDVEPRLLAYQTAHETAVELGYPSITEALEALASVSPPVVGREEIARMIDPEAFSEHRVGTQFGRMAAEQRAFEKADAILSRLGGG